jgi:hypothetical protein
MYRPTFQTPGCATFSQLITFFRLFSLPLDMPPESSCDWVPGLPALSGILRRKSTISFLRNTKPRCLIFLIPLVETKRSASSWGLTQMNSKEQKIRRYRYVEQRVQGTEKDRRVLGYSYAYSSAQGNKVGSNIRRKGICHLRDPS